MKNQWGADLNSYLKVGGNEVLRGWMTVDKANHGDAFTLNIGQIQIQRGAKSPN